MQYVYTANIQNHANVFCVRIRPKHDRYRDDDDDVRYVTVVLVLQYYLNKKTYNLTPVTFAYLCNNLIKETQ